MTLQLEEVVSIGDPRFLPDLRRRPKAPYAPTRRHTLQALSAFGMGIGLATIGALPTARPAGAAPPGGWKIWGSCSGLGKWVNDDNCLGCNQGSVICCCHGSGREKGYHKGPRSGCKYRYRPNQCTKRNGKSYGRDGWKWKTDRCCGITGIECVRYREWRCSDGYYRSSCRSNRWRKSICRWNTVWGNPCRCGT
ncbi:hypothetical protein GCM10010411_47790 [Actinomadura fulvescens]|uniref:Twin-arginine translocation signal domain-containing protein n=1 Tax=Actinomadura fulvescens TaxID=46160 RepID=A0ABP6CCB1_9ACTN